MGVGDLEGGAIYVRGSGEKGYLVRGAGLQVKLSGL